jgi:hypothetical protein
VSECTFDIGFCDHRRWSSGMARIGVYEGKEESRETVCNASAHTSLKTNCLLDGASVEQNFAVSCQQDPVSSSDANWVQRTRCFRRFSLSRAAGPKRRRFFGCERGVSPEPSTNGAACDGATFPVGLVTPRDPA